MADFYLTQEQIDVIKGMRDAGLNAQGNYSHIYKYIGDLLEAQGGPADLLNWFRGAEQANAGQGAYSEMIRAYSRRQMELRGIGDLYTPALMQEASNRVAERALADILGEIPGTDRLQTDGSWLLPTIDEIAINDAIGVGQILFDPYLSEYDTARSDIDNAGWSGTILFSALNSDQTDRLMRAGGDGLNVLDDLKNILFAYDALSEGVWAAWETSSIFSSQSWLDSFIACDTLVNASLESIPELIATTDRTNLGFNLLAQHLQCKLEVLYDCRLSSVNVQKKSGDILSD